MVKAHPASSSQNDGAISAEERKAIRGRYRSLLDGVAGFWLSHGIDWEHGGVFSSMTDSGEILSKDKFIWSQARSVWTFAALYNRIEPKPEFLRAAENSARFLLAHGRDEQGRWVYHTDREGGVIEGPISIYSDCFAVYGLAEYYRATKDESALAVARETFDSIRARVREPGFHEVAPYTLPEGSKTHGVPMILLGVANELESTAESSELEQLSAKYVAEIMDHFVRPRRKVLLEFLTKQNAELPAPRGTFAMPGHAIESMWFVMHAAWRRKDDELIRRAAEVVRWHLERGWDPEYGGLFLGVDVDGHVPYSPHWDKKLWWPHTEALYATLLAYQWTGEDWCYQWYRKVEEWAWSHFPMAQSGEWYQKLDRQGRPTSEIVALPVKDPFHLPRAAILIVQLMEGAFTSAR